MENNKKLLIKIQQLEETEADAQQQITALQRENERVGTQVDSLTSTVTSQSSLIVGLRKMVSDLNVRLRFDECQGREKCTASNEGSLMLHTHATSESNRSSRT